MSSRTQKDYRAAWMRNYRRQHAYGRWQPRELVDSDLATQHIADLRSFGLSVRAIELLAGEQCGHLGNLAYPEHHQHPARITAERAARVLAVRFDLDAIPDQRQVDASGTRRRIQALCRTGWSMRHIAATIGVTVSAVSAYAHPERGRVAARTARAIRDVYDDLSMKPGDGTRTARWAERRGWPPPLAWDDESIDDPAAQPWTDTPKGAHVAGQGVVNADSLTDCAGWGLTVAETADRLHVDRDAVTTWLRRYDDGTLRDAFARNLTAKECAA